MTIAWRLPDYDAHEVLHFVHDEASGLRAIIAIHSTHLGPSAGGCRFWHYENDEDAITDVMRLSRGMSYKNAMAGLPLGGGKSVIVADEARTKTPEMLAAFGRAVDGLGGRYVTAEDVGMSVKDMVEVSRQTKFVAGLPAEGGVGGDPGPHTSLGVFLGIKAAVRHALGKDANGASGMTAWLPSATLKDQWFGNAEEFARAWKARFGYEPDYHAASGVATVEALVNAIESAGSTDPQKVRDALSKVDFDSLYGRVAFGRGGGRLAFGGRVNSNFDYSGDQTEELKADLVRLVPAAEGVPVTNAWGGPIDRTTDGLPFAGRLPGRVPIVYGTGYSGNGVAPSLTFAKILASSALGLADEVLLADELAEIARPHPSAVTGCSPAKRSSCFPATGARSARTCAISSTVAATSSASSCRSHWCSSCRCSSDPSCSSTSRWRCSS